VQSCVLLAENDDRDSTILGNRDESSAPARTARTATVASSQPAAKPAVPRKYLPELALALFRSFDLSCASLLALLVTQGSAGGSAHAVTLPDFGLTDLQNNPARQK
jgi:hypothetical protein